MMRLILSIAILVGATLVPCASGTQVPTAEGTYNEGTLLLKDGKVAAAIARFQQAVAEYREAIRCRPEGSYYLSLGLAYKKKGMLAEAIYERALKLKYPTPSAVYLNMGIAHQKQGHKAEAISAYEAYLKAAPRARNAEQIRKVVEGLRAPAAR